MLKLTFRDITFPKRFLYQTDTDHIPLEFFDRVFPVAKRIDITLGYFSSKAIRELATSIALFVHGGGKLRIITNQFFNKEDYDNLFGNIGLEEEEKFINLFDDVNELESSLSKHDKHFFDCLKFLQAKERLEIIPVRYNSGLAHQKNFILYDSEENIVGASGSVNFTLAGIFSNSENLPIYLSWLGERDLGPIEGLIESFDKIYNKENKSFTYLEKSQLELVIQKIGNNKEVDELLIDSQELLESVSLGLKSKIEEIKRNRKEIFNEYVTRVSLLPRIPSGFVPRDYQVNAYEKWLENSKQGIFNMATGTGKTLTSLNIVLEEFKKNGFLNLFILVPTSVLLDQWIEECKYFNIINLITSKNRDYQYRLKKLSSRITEDGKAENFVFITTYSNYSGNSFQNLMNRINFPEATYIFDECHNVGTKSMLKCLPENLKYKIGLSATPQRMFDDGGNERMYSYFNSRPECFTFTYSMSKAIKNHKLCEYNYYPRFCYLNDEELVNYKSFTPRIMANLDPLTNKFNEEGERLLMLRKQIIHKASNKLNTLREIIKSLDNLDYTFIYAPEGMLVDDYEGVQEELEDRHIIKQYTDAVNALGYRARSLTGFNNDRENSLRSFKEGRLQTLVAMKVLDEGVNIPITRRAIFCSSTGNPRQFIQRRGRVLRRHDESNKKYAEIHDILVLPYNPFINKEEINPIEKRIIYSEIIRAADFAYAAKNIDELIAGELNEICRIFEINIQELIEKKWEQEKQCENEKIIA